MDNKLQYLTVEVDRILSEAPINVSELYSEQPSKPIQLVLLDAIKLVPEKSRTLGKIISFLNKEVEPKTEVYIFDGSSISDWEDLDNWKPLIILKQLAKEVSERKKADALLQAQIDHVLPNHYNKIIPASTNIDGLLMGNDMRESGSYYHNSGDLILGTLPNLVDSDTPFRLILQPMGSVDGQIVQLQKILVPSQTYLDTVEVFSRFYINSAWTIWTPRSFNEDFNRDFS